jgi:hypothetical protein
MKHAFAAATIAAVFAAGPASAAMMSCSGENMTKTSTTMQDSPNKRAMDKEIGMANAEMSKGNMRGACMHYMKAQQIGAMKSDGIKGM